jgi:pSer/pThr/pTyr-binding forkhead associated (FHA) protein
VLRCESGATIALDNFSKTELTIGRYDARSGKSPDIDLSEETDGNTVSRPHALLRNQDDQWYLLPISTTNTTRVGNAKLTPQQSWPLQPGDVVILGLVRLIFEVGSPP